VLSEVIFPGPVAAITSVNIDGEVLDPDWYRLHNGYRLVRIDGGTWPSCQRMDRDPGVTGTFTVEYVPGIDPGVDGAWAAGILACEYAKACTGGKCRLPKGVTSVTRNGVTMEMQRGLFDNGLTGIEVVDAYILSVNPTKMKKPAMVWSPDMPEHRFA
jgi:hypothetical protein